MFEMRRMLEAAMIRRAGAALTPAQIAELRAPSARPSARRSGAPTCSGRTRLLADFHVVIAAHARQRGARRRCSAELVSRSSLIALMYQSAHSAEHSYEEHVAIVDALERRDARAAVRLMEEHLRARRAATCACIRACTTSASALRPRALRAP